ncbi:MAG: hypothetical protein PHE25_00550 [Candidatus Gracilibacteria bacterium]|nr:hypothetical protein [Candidatus Gracilibacteria bacterium]
MITTVAEEYRLEVVGAGDEASGNFKGACDSANEQLTIRNLLENTGRGWKIKTGQNGVERVVESIDGVGTKVQIYTNVFNELVKQKESGEISDQELFDTSVELWERMLHDLIAMNVDDLRDGEMAIAVTNIIDINHLKGIRGKVFADSMAKAMGNVITELDIAMTAGETAILGEPKKVSQLLGLIDDIGASLTQVLDLDISEVAKNKIRAILDKAYSKTSIIHSDLEFNIGGTGLGVVGTAEKLVELKPGQRIIALQEKPTKDGIIGPRSNGITAIRKYMTSLAGEGWENLTFEEFCDKIGVEEAYKIPERLTAELSGLKMWDIATGKTTVFNPLVSRSLLGGLGNNPIADISSIIHVTGNPGRKIKDGLRGNDDLGINIDLTGVKIPQIIELIQILCNVSDEDAIGSWNMGIPYVVICENDGAEEIIRKAFEEGYIAKDIGEIILSTGGSYISNFGFGGSSLKI